MFYLIQGKTIVTGEETKGTSAYETEDEATIQFHIALSSAMQKTDTLKIRCVILDDNFTVKKREIWERKNAI